MERRTIGRPVAVEAAGADAAASWAVDCRLPLVGLEAGELGFGFEPVLQLGAGLAAFALVDLVGAAGDVLVGGARTGGAHLPHLCRGRTTRGSVGFPVLVAGGFRLRGCRA